MSFPTSFEHQHTTRDATPTTPFNASESPDPTIYYPPPTDDTTPTNKAFSDTVKVFTQPYILIIIALVALLIAWRVLIVRRRRRLARERGALRIALGATNELEMEPFDARSGRRGRGVLGPRPILWDLWTDGDLKWETMNKTGRVGAQNSDANPWNWNDIAPLAATYLMRSPEADPPEAEPPRFEPPLRNVHTNAPPSQSPNPTPPLPTTSQRFPITIGWEIRLPFNRLSHRSRPTTPLNPTSPSSANAFSEPTAQTRPHRQTTPPQELRIEMTIAMPCARHPICPKHQHHVSKEDAEGKYEPYIFRDLMSMEYCIGTNIVQVAHVARDGPGNEDTLESRGE